MGNRSIGLAIGVTVASASAQIPISGKGDAISPGSCRVDETARTQLTLGDGSDVYVAPHTLSSDSSGELFLAGTPNYVFGRDASGRGVLLGQDSILGVLIETDGTVHPIPTPIGLRLAVRVNARARPDGGWDVVFAEKETAAADAPGAAPIRVTRLWYGTYSRRAGWGKLDTLPSIARAVLASRRTSYSSLERRGERLAWAVGATLDGLHDGVVVYERVDGEWRYEFVETGSSAYLGLLYPDTSTNLLLSVVGVDTDGMPGASDQNSLYLWARSSGWSLQQRVVHGAAEGPVHNPALTGWAAGPMLSWASERPGERELRAAELLSTEGRVPLRVAIARNDGFAAVPVTPEVFGWLTIAGPAAFLPAAPARLHLLRGHHLTEATGEILVPATGSFRVAAGPDAALIVAGALGIDDAQIVVSVLVRLRVVCMP